MENSKQELLIFFKDVEEKKKYMELVRNYIQEIIDSYDGEKSTKEIWRDFIDEYKNDAFKTSIGSDIFEDFLKYKTYKELMQIIGKKEKRFMFQKISEKAKQKEKEDNTSFIGIPISGNMEARIESLLRYIYRFNASANEGLILKMCQGEKIKVHDNIKQNLIDRIQRSIIFLEDFGIIDNIIEESNSFLVKMGLSEVQYVKRNYLADEYCNGASRKEDMGVLDYFSTEELEKYQLEDLLLMTAFWETQYVIEKNKISQTIKQINDMADFKVEGLDNMETDEKHVAKDVYFLDNLIVMMLNSNLLQIKDWGIVRDIENNENEDEVIIAINNPNFRGPLLMSISRMVLEKVLEIKENELQEYKGYINEDYSFVMSKLYIPTSKYFRETMKQKCKNNPDSKLMRLLAGRTIKPNKAKDVIEK